MPEERINGLQEQVRPVEIAIDGEFIRHMNEQLGVFYNEVVKNNISFSDRFVKNYLDKTHHTCSGLLLFGIPEDALKIGITHELLIKYKEKFEKDDNNQ